MNNLVENHFGALVFLGILLPILLGLPALIAMVRNLPDRHRILVLNAAGLIMFTAWAAAMAWAVLGRPNVSYYEHVAKRKLRYLLAAVLSALVLTLLVWVLLAPYLGVLLDNDSPDRFELVTVDRGVVGESVNAVGKLRPRKMVQVSSEVSGRIVSVEVEANDRVTAGQIIARVDPATFAARAGQAQAQLDKARASLAQAKAALAGQEARVWQTEAEHRRKTELLMRGVGTIAAVEQATAAATSARAERDRESNAIHVARAEIHAATEILGAATLELERTVIRAPMDGIVLSRRVEPGQIVVSSFQTTTLFDIAEDLTMMRLEAAVDEADIGQVRTGMHCRFTVDAFPSQDFQGSVEKVGKSPSDTNGIVTYSVTVSVDNKNEELLSGMTASVQIISNGVDGALRVPLRSLRGPTTGPDDETVVEWHSGDLARIFKIDAAGQALPTLITLGRIGGGFAEVIAGSVAVGDRVTVGVVSDGVDE